MASAVDPAQRFEAVLSHLDALLQRFCWSVPSDTRAEFPDVSLYDHLHTTAAIASCLYRYHSETGTLTERAVKSSVDSRFLLLAGDVSGIQGYIFDIANIGVGGGVARRLRARSLFVQLCTEVAVDILLDELALPRAAHMLMVAGGKFYLLLPNLPHVIGTVEEVRRRVDAWFLSELNGELSLNVAFVPFGDDGFGTGGAASSQGGFGTVLHRLAAELDAVKRRRHRVTLVEKETWKEDAFVLRSDFAGAEPCQSCRKFPASGESLCLHCSADAEAGGILPQAQYLAFYRQPGRGHVALLGRSVAFLAAPPAVAPRPYRVVRLNDPDLAPLARVPAAYSYLARFAAPPDQCDICAQERARVASFQCLANRSHGKPMLALLKVDADSLGQAFIFGLKRDGASFDTVSRIATMSRMLDIFFTGWVERLARSWCDMYTVYSGGDDLLIVGAWDSVLQLAGTLNRDYHRFTGNNCMTLSAGVLLTRPDYPVARAAPSVEEALKASKAAGKDRLTVLGRTLTWADWQHVEQRWLQFRGETASIPTAFLRRLLELSALWDRYERNSDTTGLSFFPLLAYSVARNLGGVQSSAFRSWVERLLELRPSDTTQRLELRQLGLLTRLLILSRQEARNER